MTIDGIRYELLTELTADDNDRAGRHNVARLMRDNGIERQLVLRRPKGNTQYFVNAFDNGTYSKPISLGRNGL